MIEWLHNTWAVDLLFVSFLKEVPNIYFEQACLPQLSLEEIKLALREPLGE